MRRTAFLMTGDWQAAEDLTQETFVRHGPYTCTYPQASGMPPAAPTTGILVLLDKETYEPLDGGTGDHESLSGLGAVTVLR